MNIQNAFPSKWLKSGDVEDGDLNLTIDRVEIEDIGSGDSQERKPVIYFRETEKGMVLNKTNADTISKLHTPETDNWIGKQISVFATEVDFAGKQTLALRVRMRAPKTNGNGNGKTSAPVALARDNEALMARWSALWQKAQELNIQAEPLKPDATFDEAVERGKALKAQIELSQL